LAHPVRVIVHDFGVDVNEYASFGRNVPFWSPETCPLCDRPSLRSHGVRSRGAWAHDNAKVLELFVLRLICRGCPGREPGRKSATFTVLMSFLYPRKRYVLAEIEEILHERFGEEKSFSALAQSRPVPSPSTQREWCQAFLRAAPLWLPALLAWLIPRVPTTLPRPVTRDAAVALLAVAVQALAVWGPSPAAEPSVLVPLWTWGATRRQPALLPPTRSRAVARGPTG